MGDGRTDTHGSSAGARRVVERGRPNSAAAEAARWARTLVGLRDPSVRIGWIRSRILALPLHSATDVLTVVHARAEQREPAFAAAFLCVSLALADAAMQRTRAAIGQIALARGQSALARLFHVEPTDDDDDKSESPGSSASKQLGSGRPLSLGERKSLARRRDRTLLARALRDPHPDVIRILLDNPALVENDVVRLCAQRPIAAEILERVFQHRRWILCPSVRRTLALNPYTPEHLTLQLLPHLTSTDLRDMATSLQLPERVRRASKQTPSEPPVH